MSNQDEVTKVGDTTKTLIRAAELAVELLPDVVQTIRAMLNAGATEDEVRRDIRSRRQETAQMWRDKQDALAAKHGRDE